METGNAKNVANLQKAITYATGYGVAYNPSNPKLSLAQLNALFTASDAAVKAVEPVLKPYNDALDQRILDFAPMNDIVRSALAALISSDGVSAGTIADAKTLVRKITSTAKNTPPPPAAPGEPTPSGYSKSQQSYDMRLANANTFIALLAATPEYVTNEPDLSVADLTAGAANLLISNNNVALKYQPYSAKLKARDIILYAPDTGLIAIVNKLKAYIRSNRTLNATDKKLILDLKFTKPGKDRLHF